MKIRPALFAAVLTITLSLPLLGQHHRLGAKRSFVKKYDISTMMGKPTVDARVEGIRMKVWVMKQRQRATVMKGSGGSAMRRNVVETMKHDNAGTIHSSMAVNEHVNVIHRDDAMSDEAAMKSKMGGTHCIMLEVTDAASGNEVEDASATVLIASPSKFNSTVNLKSMMGDFGSLLTLEDKGEYQFIIIVRVNGVAKTKHFHFAVK